jgi:hypothetical protein
VVSAYSGTCTLKLLRLADLILSQFQRRQILPVFCRSCLHRTVPIRISPDDDWASIAAEQGGCGIGGCPWTGLDKTNPAENRKAGGSIPSLPTLTVQLSAYAPSPPSGVAFAGWASLGHCPGRQLGHSSTIACSADATWA